MTLLKLLLWCPIFKKDTAIHWKIKHPKIFIVGYPISSWVAETTYTLQWRHNGRDGVSNHQPDDYLLNQWIRRRSKKTSTLRVTGLYAGNSPVIGEFSAQMASNAENFSIWWRHHVRQGTKGGEQLLLVVSDKMVNLAIVYLCRSRSVMIFAGLTAVHKSGSPPVVPGLSSKQWFPGDILLQAKL